MQSVGQQLCPMSYHGFVEPTKDIPPLANAIPKGAVWRIDALVMPRLGQCLRDVLDDKVTAFDLATICCIGGQLLEQLYALHAAGFFHRSIKPHNICFKGSTDDGGHQVSLIDFGGSRRIGKGHEIEICMGSPTCIYWPMRTMTECDYGARDEAEALGFTLLHMLRGDTAWQHSNRNTAKKRKQDLEFWVMTPHGKDAPALLKFLQAARAVSLKTDDTERMTKEEYTQLRRLLAEGAGEKHKHCCHHGFHQPKKTARGRPRSPPTARSERASIPLCDNPFASLPECDE